MTVAVAPQALDQRLPIDSLDGLPASGMHVRDDDLVGVVEAGTKFLEQVMQASVAMGLYDGDDLPIIGAACGA